jgi:hypothetical protein
MRDCFEAISCREVRFPVDISKIGLQCGGSPLFALPSGRVAIQQDWNGVRISIRAARDWTLVFVAFWLVGWAILPFKMVLASVRSLAHPESVQLFGLLWSVGWVFGIGFALSRIVWGLGGRDSLILTATELRLSSTVFGISIRSRNASTGEVRNLRFTPSHGSGRSYTPSKIAFEDARGTVKLASGLDDSEGLAVIEAMLAVYPFPRRDRALDYMEAGR